MMGIPLRTRHREVSIGNQSHPTISPVIPIDSYDKVSLLTNFTWSSFPGCRWFGRRFNQYPKQFWHPQPSSITCPKHCGRRRGIFARM